MASRCCIVAHLPNFQSSFVGYSSYILNKIFSQTNSCLEKLQTKLQPYKHPQTHLLLLHALSNFPPLGKMYSTIMETMTVFSSNFFIDFTAQTCVTKLCTRNEYSMEYIKQYIYIYIYIYIKCSPTSLNTNCDYINLQYH